MFSFSFSFLIVCNVNCHDLLGMRGGVCPTFSEPIGLVCDIGAFGSFYGVHPTTNDDGEEYFHLRVYTRS